MNAHNIFTKRCKIADKDLPEIDEFDEIYARKKGEGIGKSSYNC